MPPPFHDLDAALGLGAIASVTAQQPDVPPATIATKRWPSLFSLV